MEKAEGFILGMYSTKIRQNPFEPEALEKLRIENNPKAGGQGL